MKNRIKHCFVLYITVLLAAAGFGFMLIRAILEWQSGDRVFMVIVLYGIALLVFGLWPLGKHKLLTTLLSGLKGEEIIRVEEDDKRN